MWIILILGTLAMCTVCFVYWRIRVRKLTVRSRRKVMEAWVRVEMTDDPVKKVIEADNVLDLALKECGYGGSIGEKLKKAGGRIPNINDVWHAHKLRNRIAHEPGVKVSDQEARRAVDAIHKAITEL